MSIEALPHVIIKNGTAVPRAVKRKDGTQVIFNEQRAALVNGDDFPNPFTINLQEGQTAYPAGRYFFSVASLNVGDFDALKVARRIELIPFSAFGVK